MTWLSRLLPQSRSLQRLNDRNHARRARHGRRHRRMANLDFLEQRTLLTGNVTVGQVSATGLLTITADTHSNNFEITETGGGEVVVSGAGSPVTTSINGTLGTPVTREGVISIVVNVPGNGQNSPIIALEQTGTNSGIRDVTFNVGSGLAPPQPAGPDLTLSVEGVSNAGALRVLDIPGGTLDATVTGSQFSSMDIEQQNCCPGSVDLEHDRVTGAVNVSLGWARNDSITFHNDNFGSTSFTLGNGPNPMMPNCDNQGSTISGDDSNFRDLTITEPLPGSNQSINVGTAESDVEVSLISFGIRATQGDGNNNTITLVSITTSGGPINNPNLANDNIVTVQGNGNDDHVTVDSSTVAGNIESFQGNGARDQAYFFGDTAGFTLRVGPEIIDVNGLEEIIQGDGDNDFAWLDCGRIEDVGRVNIANNVLISQGLAIFTPGCSQQFGDRIDVQWTNVTSSMVLEQGENLSDRDPALDLGSNIINIATPTDAGGWDPGSPVHVGDATVIDELGPNNGNNLITMGGIGGPNSGAVDFETGFLDVFTGAGGGAFVQVENTVVDFGAQGLFGPFNINSGGGGNTAVIDTTSFFGTLGGLGVSFDGGFAIFII
jgi:hypothetical protein